MHYYLSECSSCLTLIPNRSANCECCGAFQMRLNWDFFDLKMEGFWRLSELRYLTEERLDEMFGDYGLAEIAEYKAERSARQDQFRSRLMDQIEDNEYYLLN